MDWQMRFWHRLPMCTKVRDGLCSIQVILISSVGHIQRFRGNFLGWFIRPLWYSNICTWAISILRRDIRPSTICLYFSSVVRGFVVRLRNLLCRPFHNVVDYCITGVWCIVSDNVPILVLLICFLKPVLSCPYPPKIFVRRVNKFRL